MHQSNGSCSNQKPSNETLFLPTSFLLMVSAHWENHRAFQKREVVSVPRGFVLDFHLLTDNDDNDDDDIAIASNRKNQKEQQNSNKPKPLFAVEWNGQLMMQTCPLTWTNAELIHGCSMTSLVTSMGSNLIHLAWCSVVAHEVIRAACRFLCLW